MDGSTAVPHSYAECSNKGQCDRSTGTCSCFEGYEGAACERSSCPSQCSGHGVCRYIEQVGTYNATMWDAGKIQGCMCDGGWTGVDCSERICPEGDDPLTVPTTTGGDTWTISFVFNTDSAAVYPVGTFEYHLDVTDRYGTTMSTRPISIFGTDAKLGEAILDTGLVSSLVSDPVSTWGSGNMSYSAVFQLSDPTRLQHIRVRWEDDCSVAGCFPRRAAMAPPNRVTSGTASVTTSADSNIESVACSNRGVCNSRTGECQCFEGHYGNACEMQTVLI